MGSRRCREYRVGSVASVGLSASSAAAGEAGTGGGNSGGGGGKRFPARQARGFARAGRE